MTALLKSGTRRRPPMLISQLGVTPVSRSCPFLCQSFQHPRLYHQSFLSAHQTHPCTPPPPKLSPTPIFPAFEWMGIPACCEWAPLLRLGRAPGARWAASDVMGGCPGCMGALFTPVTAKQTAPLNKARRTEQENVAGALGEVDSPWTSSSSSVRSMTAPELLARGTWREAQTTRFSSRQMYASDGHMARSMTSAGMLKMHKGSGRRGAKRYCTCAGIFAAVGSAVRLVV